MAKGTVTFNPENWVDEKCEAIIDFKKLTLEVHGYKFQAVKTETKDTDCEGAFGEHKYDFTNYQFFPVNHRGEQEEHAFTNVGKFAKDKTWKGFSTGISRDGDCPFIVAAKLVANLY